MNDVQLSELLEKSEMYAGTDAYRALYTLWLRLADKSAYKFCLFGTDGRQIGPLDSIIVPRMADKSAELIVHARHEWPIN